MNEELRKILNLLNCGSLSFEPYLVLDGKTEKASKISSHIRKENGSARLSYEYGSGFRDDLYLSFSGKEILCRRVVRNGSGEYRNLTELGLSIGGITFGKSLRDDFFYHNENPRIYEAMTFPVDYRRTAEDAKDTSFDVQAGNRWADPGVVCERIGRSPYQPFPAILLSNYGTTHGLVHGTLSQRVFFHNYLVFHENNAVKLEIFSGFKDVAALRVAPGRILVDEWYLGTTSHSDDVERIFEGYSNVLRKKLPPMYGATKINRTNMVWGSWNDGIFRDIHEDMLLEEAEFLKKNFPTVHWMQIDDGYAVNVPPAHGLGMPYEGEAGVDKKKFPNGMRAFTDKLREIGLRPALWIGGFCPVQTPIFKEHSEWFIDYSYRVKASQPLDVSLPEAREYMKKALDTLCLEYGFEGVKHDFWSYAFEDSHDLYRNKEASGYEWRDWWLKEVRKRIASDGYFQTGCDIVMGNPFLGEFFTNYRYGIDIGSGDWDYVKTNFLWGIACFATHTGDLFVPNSDSVGLFPGLNDTEAMFCLNYCIATHSMVEIAGRLSKNAGSPRFSTLKKAVCNPNNGQDVYLACYDYRNQKKKTPDILYFKTPHFCPSEGQAALPVRTVGLFNIEDAPKMVSFTPRDLALMPGDYILTDVWSGEQFRFGGEFSVELPAHGSRLFAVSHGRGIQLLDANIRINRSTIAGSRLSLETDYGADAELRFNQNPNAVFFNGNALNVRFSNGNLSVKVPSAGTLEIHW